MREPVTYYSRDGKDYAVFAYTLDELWFLESVIPPSDGAHDDVWEAIKHLEARGNRRAGDEEPDAVQP